MTNRLQHAPLSRRTLLGTSVLTPLLPKLALAQDGTRVAQSASGAWPFYGQNLSGTRVADGSTISTANVSQLGAAWSVDLGAVVSGTPVIANGLVYLGAYNGTLFALELATGATVWTYATGAAVRESNLQIDLGILGSAAVDGDTVYIGDATATVHAVDTATGTARWTTKVDDQTAASIWSSPMVANGVVYVGVASIAKEVGFRGNIVALDAATGTQSWKTYVVPGESDGGGVFAVPVIDPDRGALYVGTQNAYSPNPAPYGDPISVLALDLKTGDRKWVFNAPPGGGPIAPTDDVGFSASPNLFSARIFGQLRDLIGIGQKSGTYWALDRETGEFVWRTEISPPGPRGGIEATSAVTGTTIAVPATNWPDPAAPAAGLVSAVDTATGKILWSADQTAPAASPVAISDDLLVQAGIDGILHAYKLATGAELFQTDLGASVNGGIAIAGNVIVLAAATPPFAPFVRPGTSLVAFSLSQAGPAATPAGPVGDGTG